MYVAVYVTSYLLERGVCYLVLCESAFSKRSAFAYLEDLQVEFSSQFGHKVDTVSRPYSFIEFGLSSFILALCPLFPFLHISLKLLTIEVD